MRPENNMKSHEFLILGEFLYHKDSGEIAGSDGVPVHIRKQSSDVLAVLAEHAGQVVSKDELVQTVWPGIATTDDSLVQCIADIRRALGHRVIETIPKKGYRLSPSETRKETMDDGHRRWPQWALLAAITTVICGAMALVAAAILFLDEPLTRTSDQVIAPPAVLPDKTLAVLPFVNLSGDPKLRYFSNGLSEDLTTDLSKIPQLTVISHASSFDYVDAERAFREIANDLGVRYLVRGSVRHDGNRIRINASLIDPYDGVNLWSERYDRDRRNPFDVQADVTRQIVESLSLTLGAQEAPLPRIEPGAHYMLLRGLESLRSFTARGNAEARKFFVRALELDPEYARAHAHIAVTYGRETIHRYSNGSSQFSVEAGLKAAVTAIQLDAEIPHAYYALGVLNLALGEHSTAISAARHSVRLDPNFSDGYALLGEAGVLGSDLDEALAAIRRAKLLHPHHPPTYLWVEGHILFQMERHDEAQPLLETAVESHPEFLQGLIVLAANYGSQGKKSSGTGALDVVRSIHPDFDMDVALQHIPYLLDDRREALAKGLKHAGLKD